MEKRMKLCRNCYKFAISMVNITPLGFWLHSDFKEKFQFTPNHEECDNCRKEIERYGKCSCEDGLPILVGFETSINGET